MFTFINNVDDCSIVGLKLSIKNVNNVLAFIMYKPGLP